MHLGGDVCKFESHIKARVSAADNRNRFSFIERPVAGGTDRNTFSEEIRLSLRTGEPRDSACRGDNCFCGYLVPVERLDFENAALSNDGCSNIL